MKNRDGILSAYNVVCAGSVGVGVGGFGAFS